MRSWKGRKQGTIDPVFRTHGDIDTEKSNGWREIVGKVAVEDRRPRPPSGENM